jgi:hypothetical protein
VGGAVESHGIDYLCRVRVRARVGVRARVWVRVWVRVRVRVWVRIRIGLTWAKVQKGWGFSRKKSSWKTDSVDRDDGDEDRPGVWVTGRTRGWRPGVGRLYFSSCE